MGRARELFFKNRQTFEGFIGKIVSNRLNKNDKSWRFLEIFLPNNGIFPKFKIICMNKCNSNPMYVTKNIYQRFLEGGQNIPPETVITEKLIYPDNVILLGPKFYANGAYPSVAWWGFYEHMKSKNIKVTWLDIIENKNQTKFGIMDKLNEIFSNRTENNILFLDPLAAPEAFTEYRNLDQKFFENIVTRSNFHIIGLLGDIWREKDKKQIINVEKYFD